jgi:hypothetical protein
MHKNRGKVIKRRAELKNRRRDSRGRIVKRGDRVRIVRLPNKLRDDGRMITKTIFLRSRNGVFRVAGFYPKDSHEDLVELHVGRVMGEPNSRHVIFVEAKFLEVVDEAKSL